MLRDKSLIPLSRQHQHALALCVRIERASPIRETDLAAWQAEMIEQFRGEIEVHFSAEEQILFPVARKFVELVPLLGELISDHKYLSEICTRPAEQKLSAENVSEFAKRLSQHIRKEERELFERLQALMDPDELSRLGCLLDAALQNATQFCSVNATTKAK